jgi:23S rRNA (cytidine1920-2'-O)/16S rRNA (cytidine1409-2'-O)-methyltransferase
MRLDVYLVDQKLIKSRSQATDFIKRGLVSINGEMVLKPGYQIGPDDLIKIEEEKHFVSRAGEKLFHALNDFKISLADKVVIDVGSSTGGFTDCSLQEGAQLVYAYDVGTDQMDATLRKHPNIRLFEQTNFLDVDIADADICLIDVSFTSILPIMKHLKGFNGEIVALIKPQFEAGHNKFKGVMKDKKLIEHTLIHVLEMIRSYEFHLIGLKKAHIKGKKGNQEFVLYIDLKKDDDLNIKNIVGEVIC